MPHRHSNKDSPHNASILRVVAAVPLLQPQASSRGARHTADPGGRTRRLLAASVWLHHHNKFKDRNLAGALFGPVAPSPAPGAKSAQCKSIHAQVSILRLFKSRTNLRQHMYRFVLGRFGPGGEGGSKQPEKRTGEVSITPPTVTSAPAYADLIALRYYGPYYYKSLEVLCHLGSYKVIFALAFFEMFFNMKWDRANYFCTPEQEMPPEGHCPP
jgi:hypothetical protein